MNSVMASQPNARLTVLKTDFPAVAVPDDLDAFLITRARPL